MPVALDPNEVYRYVFSTDRSKPLDKQPTLLFHYPTGRDIIEIGNKFDASTSAETLLENITLRCDGIRVILVGWENFTKRDGSIVPYDPSKLDTILTDTDLTELHGRLLKEMSQSELEKKRLVFFPPSPQEKSVTNAPKVSA